MSYKDLKALMAGLKAVYAAVDEQAALDALDAFGERWDKKYPKISQSWRANWANLSTYFKYPQEVRRLIYTTNAIEGFNRQLRKVTKAKSVFPSDDSLLKMLYLAMMDITKKWTGRRQDWSLIHAQMAIYFAERKEWVCKWDGAELSEIEPVKGGLSDSMKRAAYQWGIGRVLYDMNTVWVDIEKKGKTWFIRDDQRQKLDNAYLKLLDRLGLKPMPAGGTEALLVPKDIPEQEEDGAPPDAPGSVQSTPVPEQKPGAACSTQPAAPSAAPKGSTAKAEQAQVSSAAGSRSRTPSSAPSQNTYEYRVAASKVQKGMNTVNTLVRLEAADGKQVDAFAPGEHHALTVGTLLTGVRLSVRRQDTVVFYVLEDYRIATAPQAA